MEAKSSDIIIHKGTNCYEAEYLGEHAREIQRCFGSTCLPTAFTNSAKLEDVLAFVSENNVDCNVYACDCAKGGDHV